MKKLSYLLFTLLLPGFVLTGCGDEENEEDAITIIPDKTELKQEVYADDEVGGTLTFIAAAPWTVTVAETTPARVAPAAAMRTSNATWLRLLLDDKETSGGDAGTFTLVIKLEPNETGTDRSAAISVLCNGTESKFPLMQRAVRVDGTIPNNEKGVIINGVKWATRNVNTFGTFASSPQNFGCYYQWNRPKAWNSTDSNVAGWIIAPATGRTWAAENDPSPSGWRVPTSGEFSKLFDDAEVDREWATLNDIFGMRFTDKNTGNSIFLPATGWHGGDGITHVGYEGSRYWSSQGHSDGYRATAYYLNLGGGNPPYNYVIFDYSMRGGGYPIRPVAE